MEYFIRLRGEQQGPFTADQLQKLTARGRFARHYEVSTDEVVWKRADAFPELFPRPPAPKLALAATQSTSQTTDSVPGLVPAAQACAAEEQWYYTHNGAEQGPVGRAELERM